MTATEPDTGATVALSPRRVAWTRRRRALGRTVRQYRSSRPGMIGLVVLLVFVAMALAAPLISDPAGLKASNTVGNPEFASPSEFGPLGTDHLGRSVAAQFVWGARVSLFVGLSATILTMLIGSIVGIVAGFFGGVGRVGPDADHRVVPGHPVPAPGHRPGLGAGAVDQHGDPGDRASRRGRRRPASSGPRC